MRASHGWSDVSRARKAEIIDAIATGRPTPGPVHAELDLTDRCNVACYFCNQQDLRSKDQLPLQRTVDLIDELVTGGLRSVRLSGGGDPLFHSEILDIIDHLTMRGIVVDNLTTNGVALTPTIASSLLQNGVREVIFSLNAADGGDYYRMMRVKPALFERVCTNVRAFVTRRDQEHLPSPSVVVQFLLDRENVGRLIEMYELGRSLGADRISFNTILQIPYQRIAEERLLRSSDAIGLQHLIEELLRRDLEAQRLQLDFPIDGWNEVLQAARIAVGVEPQHTLATAASFQEKNGGCFFGWYSTAITGGGDVRPCCLMLNPEIQPLGNVRETSFAEVWNAAPYQQLRREMRDVLLTGGEIDYDTTRFQQLKRSCVERNACWLKNVYFRSDDEFYTELGAALEKSRKVDVRIFGGPAQRIRRLEIFLHRYRIRHHYRRACDLTRPLRANLKRYFGLNLTNSVE